MKWVHIYRMHTLKSSRHRNWRLSILSISNVMSLICLYCALWRRSMWIGFRNTKNNSIHQIRTQSIITYHLIYLSTGELKLFIQWRHSIFFLKCVKSQSFWMCCEAHSLQSIDFCFSFISSHFHRIFYSAVVVHTSTEMCAIFSLLHSPNEI